MFHPINWSLALPYYAAAVAFGYLLGSIPFGLLLTRFAGSGSTVLFSSHVMELVEQVCDHVSIIDKGRIVATGTTEEVRHGQTLQQAFIDLVGAKAGGEEGLSWLGSSSS